MQLYILHVFFFILLPIHVYHIFQNYYVYSVQFSSVAQLCPTLCDPMSRSTPGLPVHHQLPEFTQTSRWEIIENCCFCSLSLSFTYTQNPSSSSQIFQKAMTRGKCMTYRGEFQMKGTLEISKELESAVNTCQALQ